MSAVDDRDANLFMDTLDAEIAESMKDPEYRAAYEAAEQRARAAADERDALAKRLAKASYSRDLGSEGDPWRKLTRDEKANVIENYGTDDLADDLLASDWLAARDRRVAAEAEVKALREAADQWISGGIITTDKLREFLLGRADRIEQEGKS